MKFCYQNVYEDGVSLPHKSAASAKDGAAGGIANGRKFLGVNKLVESTHKEVTTRIVMVRTYTNVIFVPAKTRRKP